MKITDVKIISEQQVLIATDTKNISIKINEEPLNNIVKKKKVKFQNLEIIITKKDKNE